MPGTRPYRLALLSHMALDEYVGPEYLSDPGFTLDFFKISYGQTAFGVPALLEQGYEAILFYSSFGPNIMNEFGHAVVLIAKTDMDVIKALLRARALSREVVLPLQDSENIDVSFLEGMLDMRIHAVPYADMGVLQKKLETLFSQGKKMLLGGGVSAAMAAHYRVPFLRIAPNAHSVGQAIEQAKGLAKTRREERDSRDQLVAVLKLFREGVICVDQEGTAVFANNQAFELLKINRNKKGVEAFEAFYQQLLITDVLSDGTPREDTVVSILGEQFVVTTLPISIHSWLQGAVAFVSDANVIRTITGRLRESRRQSGFHARLTVDDFKGAAPAVNRLKSMVRLYAPHAAAVFIHGETGTGKEVLAQAMHNAGPRSDHPFVAINCAALPESLLESELFGYEEGAFTGAKKGGKPGVFEMAHKGTLFLDEIGDMGADAQLRLLRILETKEIVRVGGNRVIPVDIRVISASHKSLVELVRQGSFRQDLFYRLAVLRLHIPPLRSRLEDIPLLLEGIFAGYGKSVSPIKGDMLAAMHAYAWPGNVRELLAFAESYLILLGNKASDKRLLLDLLRDWTYGGNAARDPGDRLWGENGLPPPGHICTEPPHVAAPARDAPGELKRCEKNARKQRALEMLRECGGNKRRAAARLGISYNTLWRILGTPG